MNMLHKLLIGTVLIVGMLCGMNGCMSQELKMSVAKGNVM